MFRNLGQAQQLARLGSRWLITTSDQLLLESKSPASFKQYTDLLSLRVKTNKSPIDVTKRTFASEAAVVHRPAPRQSRGSGASSDSSTNKRPAWTAGLLIAPSILAAYLGNWQLNRRKWKLELLDRREKMLHAAPVDFFSIPTADTIEEYLPVTATGVYDDSKSVFIGPRIRNQNGDKQKGYFIITPLTSTDHPGKTVLVNRGWVPASWKENPSSSSSSLEQGRHGSPSISNSTKKSKPVITTKIQGLVRESENPGKFVPANEPNKGDWYYVNVAEIAQVAGLPPESTHLIEIVTNETVPNLTHQGGPTSAMDVLGGRGGSSRKKNQQPMGQTTNNTTRDLKQQQQHEMYPLPKSIGDMQSFSVMPDDHRNYAATWFTLSGATGLLAVKVIRQAARA